MTGGYPYNGYLEQVLQVVLKYLPVRYGHVVPEEPPQMYLLGSRFADCGLALIFATMIPLLRMVSTRFIYEPAGQVFMYRQLKKYDIPLTQAGMHRWCEACWKLTVAVIFSVLAFLVSYRELWFTDPAFLWLGCTEFPPCNLHVNRGVLLLYCAQTGFYIQALCYLAFKEVPHRRVWLESVMHHIVTVTLLVYSYCVNFTRVGVLVMLVHDTSDVFLEAYKLSQYLLRQGQATFFFLLFFISWVALRVLYFPLVILRSTLVDPIELVAKPYSIDPEWHHAALNALLIMLFVSHLYSTYFIVLNLIGAMRGKI